MSFCGNRAGSNYELLHPLKCNYILYHDSIYLSKINSELRTSIRTQTKVIHEWNSLISMKIIFINIISYMHTFKLLLWAAYTNCIFYASIWSFNTGQ